MVSERLELSDAPYPGLRPFRADEADIFFGRERQTDQLLARLGEKRFLAVVGPSGCGKSSLVAAGLLPALETGFMAKEGSHWQVALLRPGGQPMKNLAAALLRTGILDEERAARTDAQVFLEAALRRGPLSLLEVLRGSVLEADANLLVLVDQFEELFRFSKGATSSGGVTRDEADAFASLLIASASASGERVYVAITMRSDFLGECAAFHGLPEAINDGIYLTPRLTRDQCAAAIVGPARVLQADVEPSLVNRLLNDFGPDPDQLPLLQHALLRMWDRHEQERASGAKTLLGVADYEAIGGLARCLSNHADEALGELGAADQRVAELMFRRLSDSDTAKRDRRAPARVSEIATLAGVAVADVIRVADVFRRRGRCFLMASPMLPAPMQPEEVVLAAETILDVSHESLLRGWTKAADWIADEAEAVTLYRRLKEAALEWKRREAGLLGGASLDRALAFRARSHLTAAWAIRYGTENEFATTGAFIEASRRKRARIPRLLTAMAMATLAVSMIGLLGYQILYVWEHRSYYASYVEVHGAPRGIGKLTGEQVSHRSLSYRIVTAGLKGRVVEMSAVNSRDDLAEKTPQYYGTTQDRTLFSSVWRYEYGSDGTVTSARQYTRRGELVQGKVYVPTRVGDRRSSLAYFIGPEGTPAPVRGRSRDSAPYWAEKAEYLDNGLEATVSYLGSSGEPVPGSDHAFAKRVEYDARGNVIVQTSLDAAGNPMNDTFGNATLKTVNDALGNPIQQISLDAAGRPARVASGWAILRSKYDAHGNETERAYFDVDERPVALEDGWHRATYALDEHGNVIEVRYFDLNGKPTTDMETGCYGRKRQYDTMDNMIRRTCVDASGAATKSRDEYVTWTGSYDDSGELVEETYLDALDRPTSSKDGFAKVRFEDDARGWPSGLTFLGEDDELARTKQGYAKFTIDYEGGHLVKRASFFGVDGKPVLLEEGFASIEKRRDIWGNVVEERYFDKDGKPIRSASGYAGWRGTFDARGQEIETFYMGTGDELVLSEEGYAGLRRELDDLGRTTTIHYLGLHKEPFATADAGIAGRTSRFDAWGHEIERDYLGLDGRPATSFQGEAGWRAEYDAIGNKTALMYVDKNGAPALHVWNDDARFTGGGHARWERDFDAHRNLLEEAFFGVDGEPVVRPEGWSSAVREYDDQGNCVRKSYFGARDEAVRLAGPEGGYHSVTFAHHDRGNALDVRYFDVDQRTPIASSQGFAHVRRAYDRYGEITEEEYFGVDGARVADRHGAHRIVTTRDERRRETRSERFGPGEPPNKLGATAYSYDDWGNLTEVRHLDPEGKPTGTDEEPCAIVEQRWNAQQDRVEKTCRDAHEAVFPGLSNGAARIVYTYDRPKENTGETYYDERGKPFMIKQGYAGIRFKHDPQGRGIEISFVDGKEQLVVPKNRSFARVTSRYDRLDNQAEQAFFMADDTPARPMARVESEFDSLRRKVKDSYLGPGRQPALLAGTGQHVTLYEYDDYGNLKALRYRGVKGLPTRGYALGFDPEWQLCGRWVAKYDSSGKLIGNGECQSELPSK